MSENIDIVLDRTALRDAPRMPSSQFRVGYVSLDELTAVTVMGRVIAYYLPVGPAPRSAQHSAEPRDGRPVDMAPVGRGDAAGRTEASVLADAPRLKARRAPASGRRASRPRTPDPSAATMTQAQRDKILRGVNRSGSERG